MQKPGDLQKPVVTGDLRKDGTKTRCRYCSFHGTRAEQATHTCPNAPCSACGSVDRVRGVLYHRPGCKLYVGQPKGDDGPRRG